MIRRGLSRFWGVGMAVALVAVAATVGSAPAPASAEGETKILISSDGVHFGSSLDAGLFDGFGLMVPGDTDQARFWVKNPLSVQTEMRVSVRDFVSPAPAFAQAVTLTTWDSIGDSSDTTSMTDLFDCRVVVPSRTLGPGEIVQVDLNLTMLDVTGQIAQNEAGELSFKVGMRDGEAGPFPASACDDTEVIVADPQPSAQDLATTGYQLPSAVIVAAGALIGSGFFLVGRRRRRREDA